MSSSTHPTPVVSSATDPTAERLSVARWVALGVLLLTEAVAISARFDLRPAPTFLHLGLAFLADLALAVAAALLVFGRGSWWAELRRLCAVPQPPLRTTAFVLGQVAAFAAFLTLTGAALEGGTRAPVWVVAWLMSAATTLALAAAIAIVPTEWPGLLWRSRGLLVFATAVGLAALASSEFAVRLWHPLGGWTLAAVQFLVRQSAGEVVCRPDEFVVGTSAFTVHVAPACSGYQGIGLILVFLGVYLRLARRSLRFPQALLLLPVGVVVIWMANAVRIAALILIGSWWSPGVALGGFHSQAGWLAFILVSLGLVALTRRLQFFSAAATAESAPNPMLPFLVPLLAILTTGMVTGAFSSGFDPFYGAAVVVGAAVLWLGRRHYSALRWSWSWSAVALGALAYGLWVLLDTGPQDGTSLQAGLARLPSAAAVIWVAFRIVGSVVTIPLAEELAFRGFLARRLIASDFEAVPIGSFTWTSFLASSLLFGAMHGRWFAGTVAGALFALALYRRRRLFDAVLAHGVSNALIAAQVLIIGNWHLWL